MTRFSKYILVIVLVVVSALAVGCGSRKATKTTSDKVIIVSIPPYCGLTKAIVGDDFEVQVLLPEGSSPETFAPTIRQIAAVQNSAMFLSGNLMEFEKVITKRLSAHETVRVINISEGCELIENEHNECECEEEHQHHTYAHSHHHHGGVDPHVWLSPFELETIARNIGEAVCAAYPDSVKYEANLQQLIAELRTRQVAYEEQLKAGGKRHFLIYHPALSYLARDYGLVQIPLENEGKNPTPASLAEVVSVVDKWQIGQMMYQSEYPQEIIKPIVDVLGVNMVQINPLSADVLSELDRVINIISE